LKKCSDSPKIEVVMSIRNGDFQKYRMPIDQILIAHYQHIIIARDPIPKHFLGHSSWPPWIGWLIIIAVTGIIMCVSTALQGGMGYHKRYLIDFILVSCLSSISISITNHRKHLIIHLVKFSHHAIVMILWKLLAFGMCYGIWAFHVDVYENFVDKHEIS
jgi:hypothetical protein